MTATPPTDNAYFIANGSHDADGLTYRDYQPTKHTESPWGEGFQHGSPPAALVATVLEDGARGNGLDLNAGRFSRMTVEILGAVPLTELRTRAQVIRPGKRISLLEAVVEDESGREYIRGTGWWIKGSDSASIERGVGEDMPGPEGATSADDFLGRWSSGYIDSIEVTRAPLSDQQLAIKRNRNRNIYWSRTDLPVVAGREDSPWMRVMKTVDIANGLNNILDTDEWTYMNVDTTVYLHRPMRGEWLGLNAEANYGADGIGTTVTRIYDEHGPIGSCNQGLILNRR